MSKKKVELHVVGRKTGMPTVEDLAALYKKLTGKEPTAEEMAEARKELAG